MTSQALALSTNNGQLAKRYNWDKLAARAKFYKTLEGTIGYMRITLTCAEGAS
jgi:hypothetical protein